MNLYQFLVLPFLFGLIGFLEPCSLGINMMFLRTVQKIERSERWKAMLIFMIVRALILASLGFSAAFIGNTLFLVQTVYFLIFGGVFIIIGLNLVLSKRKLLPFRTIRIASWFGLEERPGSVTRLGLIGGLTIPACAIPLIAILLGQSVFSGKAAWGFLSLFIFGLALTLPLIVFSSFRKYLYFLKNLAKKVENFRVIKGVVFILLGVLTMLSSIYWKAAIS